MIKRKIKNKILSMAEKFPVISLTGTRQCGKSTLLKNSFPDYTYVSLEDRDIRDFAMNDPRGFLREYDRYVIIDEVQRCPDLFSYIQTKVDEEDISGRYILSGSHNFLLMESVSQSLAGRCAILKLAPFSAKELKNVTECRDLWKLLFTGGYPRLYDKNIEPNDYFPSYTATYIERDVRSIKAINDTSAFVRFVRICAARSGQILNISELSSVSGLSVPTVNAWLSILEQSYILYRISPYYNNYSKRLIKSPKLYFYDTGLLCYLLGIESPRALEESLYKGAIFETFIFSEYIKSRIFNGKEERAYYWRDSNQNEIDLLTEDEGKLRAYEIKAAETMNERFTSNLRKFSQIAGIDETDIACIYTGRTTHTSYGGFLNYMDVFD